MQVDGSGRPLTVIVSAFSSATVGSGAFVLGYTYAAGVCEGGACVTTPEATPSPTHTNYCGSATYLGAAATGFVLGNNTGGVAILTG